MVYPRNHQLLLTSQTATIAVIPAKAGIQKGAGFRSLPRTRSGVKPGMTNCVRPLSSCIGGQRGFTLAELITVMAVIGIVSAAAFPMFTSFLTAMQTKGAAQELATVLQQARELAIARNTSYTVQIDTNGNRLRFVDRSGTPWTGPGTDGDGYRRLVNQAQLAAVNTNPVFNPLGTAGGGRITVQNSRDTSALDVVVSSAGRVRIAQVGQ